MNITESKTKDQIGKFDITSYGELNFKNSLSSLYHENTKLTNYSSRQYGLDIAKFDQEYFNKRASQPFKIYSGKKMHTLDDYISDNLFPESDLSEAIRFRRSVREFEQHKISLFELAQILFHGYGITYWEDTDQGIKWGFRTVPSGGALYPLEIYVLNINSSIDQGLYHYRPDINCLEFLKTYEVDEQLEKELGASQFIDMTHATSIIFVTSVAERYLIKYGDRGYRWMLLETGFVMQNINLISQGLNLGGCILGGFLDDPINRLLGVDGLSETVQSIFVLGKPASHEEDD